MSGNVPELRFAGFTDPWEQRKLGELVDDIATGKSVNSDDGIIGPGDVGIMKTSCVSYDTFDARESKRVLPEEQSLVACPVEAKTLIVSRMNTPDRVGACGFAADNWPNLFLPDRLWRVRLRNSVDPYLVYVLLTSDGSKEVLRGMASGTSGSMHNIPKESFLDMELTLPTSLEEQNKIAKQFACLNSLITLHQRKHDQLATLKKSLLEKMFPKPGSDVPELRFAGFTDPWEQRKFGDLYRPTSEKNDLTFGRDRIISVANMHFSTEVYVTDDDYLRTYNVMRLGDIAFEGHSNKEFAHGRFVENYLADGIVSHIFIVLRPRVPYDLKYWRYAINNERLMRDVLTRSTKASTMMHDLVIEDFLQARILVPSLQEQWAVGALFDYLDSLITLHQRKHDQLVTLKKSLLEKMFV